MSGNAKLRWFLLAPILVALFVVVASPVSSAGELEDAQEQVRQNPNSAEAHFYLGRAYGNLGQFQEAIASFKESIRIRPDVAEPHNNLGGAYGNLGRYQEAIAEYKEALRINPDHAKAHGGLGFTYDRAGQYQEAIASYSERLWTISLFNNLVCVDNFLELQCKNN